MENLLDLSVIEGTPSLRIHLIGYRSRCIRQDGVPTLTEKKYTSFFTIVKLLCMFSRCFFIVT